jgi:hypothetical protein
MRERIAPASTLEGPTAAGRLDQDAVDTLLADLWVLESRPGRFFCCPTGG